MAPSRQPSWTPGRRPDDDMARGWFHVAPGEEFSVSWKEYEAHVRARGHEWELTWTIDGKVYLNGNYRDAWTWEYRRGLKKGCGHCQELIASMEAEAHGKLPPPKRKK